MRSFRARVPWCAMLLMSMSCGGLQGGQSADQPAIEAPEEQPSRVEPEQPEPSRVEVPEAPTAAEPPPSLPPAAADRRDAAHAERHRTLTQLEDAFPLHGVAFHFLAQVFSEPSEEAVVVGYMRRGARFRAGRGVEGSGCDQTWHPVPGNGYVCKGRGFLLGREPRAFEAAPPAPRIEAALPYPYARVAKQDVLQYWKQPTAEETQKAREGLDALQTALAALEPDATSNCDADDALATRETAAPDAPLERATDTTSDTSEPEAPWVTLARELLPSFVRMRMHRDDFVSLARQGATPERERATAYARTVRGGYLPADALAPVEASELHGTQLTSSDPFPLGLVRWSHAKLRHRDPQSGELVTGQEIPRISAHSLASETMPFHGRTYQLTREGHWLPRAALRVARGHERPRKVPADAQWIHVSLSQQTLVAYEGDQPVFATLISSGKEGYETPTGLFRILSKHVSTTMDDQRSADEAYSIDDVPWTMYFAGSIALHGAFWHEQFGRTRSHGCVNLAPRDAQWLFAWTQPTLPLGWHGVLTLPGQRSTWVLVEE